MSEALGFNNIFSNCSNAAFGMTIQKTICDLYGIYPNEKAVAQFNAVYDKNIALQILPTIKSIFESIGLKPIECLTFKPSKSSRELYLPHNFVLEDGETLSIRTNKSGDKVAPRVVGQCGIETFNEHFSQIVDRIITDKQEIKEVVFNSIHLMLPVFVDYLFTSDYIIWVYFKNNEIKYETVESKKLLFSDLKRESFTFTKNLGEWNESTTLKYNNKSLAEIQIHKNRTFKFRFIMSSLLELLREEKITSETLGITAEKTVCDLFSLKYPDSFKSRYSPKLEEELMPIIVVAFANLPNAIKHTGSMSGERGGNSKCSYDFILEGNKKLSLKTNTGKMVCPPEVGQPSASTCYKYFGQFTSCDHIDSQIFKEMVLNYVDKMLPIYIDHLFDSDYLLWIYKKDVWFNYKIFEKGFGSNIKWEKSLFSFTKQTIEDWNESNTLKYKNISIGEFQVHKARDCFKFRFNLENLVKAVQV